MLSYLADGHTGPGLALQLPGVHHVTVSMVTIKMAASAAGVLHSQPNIKKNTRVKHKILKVQYVHYCYSNKFIQLIRIMLVMSCYCFLRSDEAKINSNRKP